MCVHNPHYTFNLLMGFRISNHNTPTLDSHYLFRIEGDLIFPNFLYYTYILNSSLTFLSFYLPDSLNRLISRCLAVPDASLAPVETLSLSQRFFQRVIFPKISSHWFLLSYSRSSASRSCQITLVNLSLSLTLSSVSCALGLSLVNPQPLDLLLSPHAEIALLITYYV